VIYGRKFYQEAIVANINIPILAIGLATQESLLKFQLTSSTPPTFDSAGLANVIKEMGYKKCLVFCGEQNPRIVTMTDADIDAFPCYASHDEINVDVSKIRNETKLVVLIYTHQSLKVFIKEMPVNENQEAVLIVASRRIEELAKEYGFRKIVLAESPHDKEMVKAALAEV
jgi:uroporphyrinogen-III synthase